MGEDVVVDGHVVADAELITAVRRGDTEAFGTLFARHADAATAVARRYLAPSDADDAVAGAFEKVLAVLRGGKGPDVAFRAYLFTVVRRRAIEMLDRGRRTAPTDDDAVFESAVGPLASTEDPALRGFEDRTVARAYEALPERWRAVLWYTDIEQMTPAEVAPALGMTPNAVSALAYRAREGLRQSYLQQHLQSGDDDGCRRASSQLGAYVRGGLSRRETAHVEAHLEECGRCRAAALELGDLAQGMRATVAPLVLGLAGVAALGGLPFVLGAGAVGGGVAGGGAAGAADGASGTPSGGSAAGEAGAGREPAVTGAAAGAAAAGLAGAGGAAAVGSAGGLVGAGAAPGAAGAVAGIAGAAAGSTRWLVGAAAGVAGLLVLAGIGLGAGWFDGPQPAPSGPPTAVAPAVPSPSGSSSPTTPRTTPSVPTEAPSPDVPGTPDTVPPLPGRPVPPRPTWPSSPEPVRPTSPATVPTSVPAPTASPSGRPTASPAPSPTAIPTATPTAAPSPSPTVAPSPSPTVAPSPSPSPSPTPAPPVPATVSVDADSVLVAGGAGELALAVERPSPLAAPLTMTVELPASATWADPLVATGPGAASWTCAADDARTATCVTAPLAGRLTGRLTGGAMLAAEDDVPTVVDELALPVDLERRALAPGDVRVVVSSPGTAPSVSVVTLGTPVAVDVVAAPDAGGDVVVLTSRDDAAADTVPVDVTVSNRGRALAGGVLTVVVPAGLTVTAPACGLDGTTLACDLGRLAAASTQTVALEVSAPEGAPLSLLDLTATLTTTTSAGAGPVRRATVEVQVDTAEFALLSRHRGHLSVVEIGAPLVHCADDDDTCRDRADGTTNNNDIGSRVVLDGTGGAPRAESRLELPAGSTVVRAYLQWAASYSRAGVPGTPDDRASGELLRPDGTSVSVNPRDTRSTSRLASDLVDGSPLGRSTDYYQATADVTEIVRAGGAGVWSFVAEVTPSVAAGAFAGWSLTVVVEDPDAPESEVRVYDGIDGSSGSGTVEVGFAPEADSDLRLGATVWEGDRGLTGDQVLVGDVALTPERGLRDSRNAFDSTMAGFAHANAFGADVKGFLPVVVAPGAQSMRFVFAGDAYALGLFTLTLVPR